MHEDGYVETASLPAKSPFDAARASAEIALSKLKEKVEDEKVELVKVFEKARKDFNERTFEPLSCMGLRKEIPMPSFDTNSMLPLGWQLPGLGTQEPAANPADLSGDPQALAELVDAHGSHPPRLFLAEYLAAVGDVRLSSIQRPPRRPSMAQARARGLSARPICLSHPALTAPAPTPAPILRAFTPTPTPKTAYIHSYACTHPPYSDGHP